MVATKKCDGSEQNASIAVVVRLDDHPYGDMQQWNDLMLDHCLPPHPQPPLMLMSTSRDLLRLHLMSFAPQTAGHRGYIDFHCIMSTAVCTSRGIEGLNVFQANLVVVKNTS